MSLALCRGPSGVPGFHISITAFILVGRAGAGQWSALLNAAHRAAARDLAEKLKRCGIGRVVIAAPDVEWVPDGITRDPDPPGEPFHFGRRLASLIRRYGAETALYFGGGSAPLLTEAHIRQAIGHLEGERVVVTNNLHAGDWFGLTSAQAAIPAIARMARDNGMAWSLRETEAFAVHVLNDPPATHLDIDVPVDLALLANTPDLSPCLAEVVRAPDVGAIPVADVVEVVARDGSRLALIGRVAPPAWDAVSKASYCWIRAFSEERGMVTSGRQTRGEARSLLGHLYDAVGPAGFFRALADTTDAAVMDSRVLMAHFGIWPEDADRFASDALDAESVRDPWLRAFTEAARDAPIPVLLGGQGLVSGGLYVLADLIASKRAVNNSR